MKRRSAIIQQLVFTVLFSVALALQADAQDRTSSSELSAAAAKSFSLGTAISSGQYSSEAAVAINGTGKSVALWEETTPTARMWTRSHPLGGSWGSSKALSGVLSSVAFPLIQTSKSGIAIAVWTDYGVGVWTADRSASGVWTAPQLILPGAQVPILVMNAQGDAALLWSVYTGGATPLYAMRRSAGQGWGPTEVVATSATAGAFTHATLAANGDLIAAWEAFTFVCVRGCRSFNFVLHVSREPKGSTTWQDSGRLTSPDVLTHNAFVAADAAGHAGAVYETTNTKRTLFSMVSIVQAGPGARWSRPATVFTSKGFKEPGFSSDATGNATVAWLDFNGPGPEQVYAVTGSIVTNTWNTPVGVSGTDTSLNRLVFASSSSGAAVLSWTGADPNTNIFSIRASARPSTLSPWTAPQSISPSNVQLGAPEAAAVNDAGNATVIFSATPPNNSFVTEYASSY